MRRVNVDRMRRHQRRGRRGHIPPRSEVWATLINYCGLSFVSGPFPLDVGESVPLGCFTRRDLLDWQARHGLTADGELGPQSWMALARYNEDVRAM